MFKKCLGSYQEKINNEKNCLFLLDHVNLIMWKKSIQIYHWLDEIEEHFGEELKRHNIFNANQLSRAPTKPNKELLTALEGLAAVVNRVTCSAPIPGSTLYVHACHPRGALPAPGLAGCPVGRGE
jgi:hypothetical protein